MTTTRRPTLGIIGAGKVGCTLARLLWQAGYHIAAVHSRSDATAKHLAEQVKAQAVSLPAQVVAQAELTLLTVPDDVIAVVAEGLAGGDVAGKGIVHTSGAHDVRELQSLRQLGAMTGSFHPAYPFADVETAMKGLPGATFAVEATHETLRTWLDDMAAALEGQVMVIPAGGKAAYHLALALTSNYTVTLYAVAESLLESLGAETTAAENALNRLLAGTLDNLAKLGIPDALTGPLAREDVGTIASHLALMRGRDKTLAAVYRGLARLSYPMLQARGISHTLIEQLLQQDESYATDNP